MLEFSEEESGVTGVKFKERGPVVTQGGLLRFPIPTTVNGHVTFDFRRRAPVYPGYIRSKTAKRVKVMAEPTAPQNNTSNVNPNCTIEASSRRITILVHGMASFTHSFIS